MRVLVCVTDMFTHAPPAVEPHYHNRRRAEGICWLIHLHNSDVVCTHSYNADTLMVQLVTLQNGLLS